MKLLVIFTSILILSVMGIHETFAEDTSRSDISATLLYSLDNPNSISNNQFGSVISASSDYLVISVKNNVVNDISNVGTVYVYDIKNGNLLYTIDDPLLDSTSFGEKIALLGDKILVTAELEYDSESNYSGAVYIFNAKNGELLSTIYDPNPKSLGFFGTSITIINDDFLITGMDKPLTGTMTGSVYRFDGDTGELLLEINELDLTGVGYVGRVSSVGNNILLADTKERVDSEHVGKVYMFDGDTGELLLEITNPDMNNSNFGRLIKGQGDNIMISNPWIGYAYIFDGLQRGVTNTPIYTIGGGIIEDSKFFEFFNEHQSLVGGFGNKICLVENSKEKTFDEFLFCINNPHQENERFVTKTTTENLIVILSAPSGTAGGTVYVHEIKNFVSNDDNLFVNPIFNADGISLSLDKNSYQYNDKIKVSGQITNLEYDQYVTVQIIDSTNNFVKIDQFLPMDFVALMEQKESSINLIFTKEYDATGPLWKYGGAYAVKISYMDQNTQQIFEFNSQLTENKDESEKTKNEIKSIASFVDLDKDPQSYIDRYNNEESYKEWFDENYSNYTIEEAVGLSELVIEIVPEWIKNNAKSWIKEDISENNFASEIQYLVNEEIIEVSVGSESKPILPFVNTDKNPQSYIDRYNNEESYKEWFDENYSNYTIEEAVGYEQVIEKVPPWLKNAAEWWVDDLVSENDFLDSIKYLIDEEIIETKWIRHN